MAITDRLTGFESAQAIKSPALVASTTNITLYGTTQVIDGITPSTGDRVLAKDQTNSTDNGIYIVNASTWSRAKDFDGKRDAVRGTIIYVSTGTIGGGVYTVTSTGDNIPGSDAITFQKSTILAVSSAVTVSDFMSNSGLLSATSTANARTVLNAALKTIPVVNTSSTYAIASSDHGYLFNHTTGTFTLTVSSAAALGAGFWCAIKGEDRSTSVLTILPEADDIDGGASVVLSNGAVNADSFLLVCDGNNFFTIGRRGGAGHGYMSRAVIGTGQPAAGADADGRMTFVNSSGAAFNTILAPGAAAALLIGAKQTIMRTDASTEALTISASATDVGFLVGGTTGVTLPRQYDYVTVYYASTELGWQVLNERRTFVSSSQAITLSATGSDLTVNHGLGVRPMSVEVSIRNLASTLGYSTGQEVVVPPYVGAASTGYSLIVTTTAITLRQGAAIVIQNSTGAATAINSTSWGWVVRARA